MLTGINTTENHLDFDFKNGNLSNRCTGNTNFVTLTFCEKLTKTKETQRASEIQTDSVVWVFNKFVKWSVVKLRVRFLFQKSILIEV